MKFVWDQDKAAENLKKHDVSFEDATTVFGDYFSITISDPIHSVGEERFLTIGQSGSRKILVVAHTEKDDTVRIINARLASKQERATYEEE